MLMMHNVPKSPIISNAVMLECWKCICFHVLVSRLMLTKMMDLVLSGCFWWVPGYIVVQFQLVWVLPLKLT